MSRRSIAIAIVAGLSLAVLVFALVAWWFVGSGTLQVQVSGDDTPNLNFSVPFALVRAGIMAIPDQAFAEVRSEFDGELATWLPSFERACDALADGPDGVYVRVESGSERVLVEKRRKELRILVEDGSESVRVKVPIKAIRLLGRELADDL